ncbi:MAG: hypothetical protein H7122_11675 [Chitinophagaceae bacterium]|nr:hypothetical protein [Chitinophagaceae bacterium]
MLALLAAAFWFIFFSYAMYRMIRNQAASMTRKEVVLAYGTKILFGCLYGYIFLHFYNGDDTWAMHASSIREKQLLLNDPYRFFWEFTPGTAIRNGDGLVDIIQFYLVDLEYCLQAKTLGIINLITQDNYYVNVVFWNFFIFWGHYWLFALLTTEFPGKRKFYFIVLFLFPPAAFWLSGIRSDGLIFLSCALLLLYFHRWLCTRRLSFLILSIFGFIGILIFRPQIAALIIPAIVSWWFAHRFPQRPLIQFLWVYVLAAIVFFVSAGFQTYNMPAQVVQRQQEFMQLKGTSFHLDSLQPSVQSFASIFPQAAVNTFIRPYPWEVNGVLQWMAVVEVILFWGILLFVVIRHERDWKKIVNHPLILVLFFTGFFLYLFIGYTIPFPGAIVRYKIMGEVFLLSILLTLLKHSSGVVKLK